MSTGQTCEEILDELKGLGSESYKRILMKHGVKEPCFGAKIGDMQKIVKRIKKDYQLSLLLYASGVYDAMYLAGLIADDAKMTKKDLKNWMAKANCRSLASWTVPWVASGSAHGWELAHEWIESKKELVAMAGWGTISSFVSITPDDQIDLDGLKVLIGRIASKIQSESDLVRYQMNACLIAIGTYVAPLTQDVIKVAKKLGSIQADLGDNDCQVPDIIDTLEKVAQRGSVGKKRKSAKC
jgi:3-methyladenine DNA glycosylase AlkD